MMDTKKGVVIWLTGLPCSGKTTLAKEIEKYFKDKKMPVQRLDGDIVRKTISNDLGFSKKDRERNVKRLSYVAQMLSDNGINVVSAFISPHQKARDFARGLCENYIEVYVKCSVKKCEERDVKGMYAKAKRGEIKNFTGAQDLFEEPESPEIIVDTERERIEESVGKIVNYVKNNLNGNE